MDTLTLRKLILIGIQVASPDGAVKARVAMWIPQLAPFKRSEGTTAVTGVFPHEAQALRDGAIVEELFDFYYPKQPTLDTLRAELMPIWERRTLETLGFLPNGAPVDRDPKPELRFTAV